MTPLAFRRILAGSFGAVRRPVVRTGLGRLRSSAGGSLHSLLGADPALHIHESGSPARTTAGFSAADLVRAARSRFARMDTPERLVPVGVCALLLAAALVSALPPAGAATAHGAGSQYGMGMDDPGSQAELIPNQDDPGQSTTRLATYAPELVIVNTLQNPTETAQPYVGFVWYVVKNGDSLKAIADRNHIKIETLYFANKKSVPDPEGIKAGLRLLIPPADGVVVVVVEGDTLVDLSSKYHVTVDSIIDGNALANTTIVAGQLLLMPGADPGELAGSSGGSGGKYTGGSMWWPVSGGKNYISQYYSARSHRGLDIAAKYGTTVIAAAGGTVVYAGWRSTQQGGYVVWIKHTSGLYTTYNHLTSKRVVRSGQSVRAGQKIGLVGTSGVSTGPHLHFEVWQGYPWALGDNSDAVNPCKYLAQC